MIEINVPLGPIAYVKVSGNTSHEVLAQLTDVLNGEIPGKTGQLLKETHAANVQERLGRELGAELVGEEDSDRLKQDPRAQRIPEEDPISEFQGKQEAPAFEPTPRDPAEFEQEAPGAPEIMGRKAYFASWQDETGSHGAFVHPFLYEQDWSKVTADPEDPRLRTGEAWFFQQAY